MDPASLMELWITSSGNNDAHFYNEEYDSYISAAAHATSQNERFENFHKAEKILEEQLPIIPIYYYSEPVSDGYLQVRWVLLLPGDAGV